ncbi:DUF58 domain-containing protein [Rufibacter quisquiliarum]|uniref:Uncharacterized protein (DUF58 family) n=1 Tax=Rufibacter quisquiliarum TaxID=1549639 RepID=A0A839GT16_9BACT|nr:DUF58 domain-containing protein [Rufibacter quisquiliarum]MBA9078017.1 uncharacterized protein (DUF58 family) [Rufibacter quisquiliarum]
MSRITVDLDSVRHLKNLEFLAKRLVEGFITGLHKSPYHGFSVEFSEHRLYNSGESTRHMDWKVFARTDKLFVKRYEEETNLRCQLLLDVSGSMYYPTANYGKLAYAVLSAAALATLLQKQRDAVGLTTFSDVIELQTPIKSTGAHLHTLLLHLQQQLQKSAPPQKETKVAAMLHHVAQQLPKRSLVILFSDLLSQYEQLDEIFLALQHLRHQQHEVLLFHFTHAETEEEFQFPDRPFTFIGLENGEKVKVQPAELRETYVAAMRQFKNELKLRCGQYRIDLVSVDLRDPIEKVLQAYLVKRQKVR